MYVFEGHLHNVSFYYPAAATEAEKWAMVEYGS